MSLTSFFRRKPRGVGATSFPDLAKRIHEKCSDQAKWKSQLTNVHQLSDPAYLASYEGSIGNAVMGELRKEDRTLLDFGCWSGITSLYLQDLTQCHVVGSDIKRECMEFANEILVRYAPKKSAFNQSSVEFIQTSPSEIPIADGSIDIAVVNQVFCNMYAPQVPLMLKELVRILNRNGRLILVDSNNPKSPEVVDRLLSLYQKIESEDGGYFKERQKAIDHLLPDSAPNTEHARATCYMSKEEIQQSIHDQSSAVKSYFDPTSLKPPVSMRAPIGAPSSPTDPKKYVEMLEMNGLNCSVGSFYPPDNKLDDEASFYIVGRKSSN